MAVVVAVGQWRWWRWWRWRWGGDELTVLPEGLALTLPLTSPSPSPP